MEDAKIIEIAVKKQGDLSTEELAIRSASETEGVEINDEGEVEELTGDFKEVLEKIVVKYEETMGDVAVNLIAQEMKKNDVEASNLPEKLSERY